MSTKSRNTRRPRRANKPRKPRANNQLTVMPVNPPMYMSATNPALADLLQRKRNQSRKPRRRNRFPKGKVAPVSECALKFASAMLDPEHTPVGACIPWGFPRSTYKAKGYCQGRMVVGTNGVGFVLARPENSNDLATCRHTSATTVGTQTTAISAFTNTVDVTSPILPYTTAQIQAQPQIRSRCVGLVLKVRYAGTEAGRNGTVFMFEDANHVDIVAAATTPQQINLTNTRTNERPRMDGGWHTVVYSGPVEESEADFRTRYASFATPPWCLAAIVLGTAGDVYDFESYQHQEYAGGYIPAQGTAESDPEGYGKVMETLKNRVQGTPVTQETAPDVFASVLGVSREDIASSLKSYGLNFAKEMLSKYFAEQNRNLLLT